MKGDIGKKMRIEGHWSAREYFGLTQYKSVSFTKPFSVYKKKKIRN